MRPIPDRELDGRDRTFYLRARHFEVLSESMRETIAVIEFLTKLVGEGI